MHNCPVCSVIAYESLFLLPTSVSAVDTAQHIVDLTRPPPPPPGSPSHSSAVLLHAGSRPCLPSSRECPPPLPWATNPVWLSGPLSWFILSFGWSTHSSSFPRSSEREMRFLKVEHKRMKTTSCLVEV